jgi:hypothetical protein
MNHFEHLKQLRRFLAERKTGRIRFNTEKGEFILDIREGAFLVFDSKEAVVLAIRSLLTYRVFDTVIQQLQESGNSTIAVDPDEVILKACYTGKISDIRILELQRFFSHFPPVRIRLTPLHRFGSLFPAFSSYMALHRQFISKGFVSIRDYLSIQKTPQEVSAAVRLFLVLYILGLITPVEPPKKNSVIGRLIKRVRGL